MYQYGKQYYQAPIVPYYWIINEHSDSLNNDDPWALALPIDNKQGSVQDFEFPFSKPSLLRPRGHLIS
jgi:hypothetical protein